MSGMIGSCNACNRCRVTFGPDLTRLRTFHDVQRSRCEFQECGMRPNDDAATGRPSPKRSTTPWQQSTTPWQRSTTPWQILDLTAIEPVACPCGLARRALADFAAFPGTVHLTEISEAAVPHHHRDHTEVYVILECDDRAAIELDGVEYPVRPMTLIAIPPGVVHRAVGVMKTLIVCSPDFDPSDEVVQAVRSDPSGTECPERPPSSGLPENWVE